MNEGAVDHGRFRLWLRWVVANGVGGLVAFPAGGLVIGVGLAAIWSIWPGDPRPAPAVIATLIWATAWPAIGGAIGGCVSAAITGLALVWLVRADLDG